MSQNGVVLAAIDEMLPLDYEVELMVIFRVGTYDEVSGVVLVFVLMALLVVLKLVVLLVVSV